MEKPGSERYVNWRPRGYEDAFRPSGNKDRPADFPGRYNNYLALMNLIGPANVSETRISRTVERPENTPSRTQHRRDMLLIRPAFKYRKVA